MKKKKIIIAFFALILIAIPAFIYIQYIHKADISNQVMEDYLNSYKSNNKDVSEKLLDYKINKINIESKNIFSTNFSFTIVFSVHPYSNKSVWIAGNGVLGNDGWVNNKYKEVTVIKHNGIYIIKSIGIA